MDNTVSARAAQDRFDAVAAAIAPVAASERIDTLDFIRGLAVMGILAANIVAFGQPFEAYMYPAAFKVDAGDPGGWMWIAQFILIDGKMRGLFTLLFGAGLYLFMEKAWARGATRKLQVWRLFILMLFGMIHFFFIWPGDILFYYALFGFLALACIRWSIRTQLVVGLLGYIVGVLFYAAAMSIPWAIMSGALGEGPELAEAREGMVTGMEDTLAQSAVPNAAIASGDYGTLVMHRLTEQWSEPLFNALLFGFETLPLMLLGMALYRLGFFSGAFDRGKMLLWGWVGVICGGFAHLAIGLAMQADGFSYYGTLAAFVGLSPLPRLWMVLGMAALLVVYAPSATGWLGDRVRAAGRAAFTNYLGTSVVMMFVFHGWALGLFGALNRPQLYIVVALTWVLMLAWSKPWLDRYRYGPLEWLWRCLTYRQAFPLRK
ncbi:MAG: putative membrane protein [Porphyrobacter sp. HL-46]|nr:MAG: putative membrane protein [Porphyrobacter sp. HL-46]